MAFILFGKVHGAGKESVPITPLQGIERTYTDRFASGCLDGKYYRLASGRRVEAGEVYLDVPLADIEENGQITQTVWDSVGLGDTLNAGRVENLLRKNMKRSSRGARYILKSALHGHFDEKGNCQTSTDTEFPVSPAQDELSRRLAAEYSEENAPAPDITILF